LIEGCFFHSKCRANQPGVLRNLCALTMILHGLRRLCDIPAYSVRNRVRGVRGRHIATKWPMRYTRVDPPSDRRGPLGSVSVDDLWPGSCGGSPAASFQAASCSASVVFSPV
jgi:hypothetical protein